MIAIVIGTGIETEEIGMNETVATVTEEVGMIETLDRTVIVKGIVKKIANGIEGVGATETLVPIQTTDAIKTGMSRVVVAMLQKAVILLLLGRSLVLWPRQ